MKKLLLGCIAAVAALMALSGCDQDNPLNWLRKALILALNDSAEAFVNRSSK